MLNDIASVDPEALAGHVASIWKKRSVSEVPDGGSVFEPISSA